MDCVRCGTPNEPGRKFCMECGAPLVVVCAVCLSPNPPASRFCGECGSELVPAVARATLAEPATERRLVTVLFVDLVGFTELAGRTDPEDVRGILGRYFDLASEAVRRHGGLVEKFIGDAVMAVWGTPVAHEDDAERAVRAALEIVPGVAALGRDLEVGLQARAGVLTGEAAANVGAVEQALVVGDLVNTAARLQSVAEPGTVLVGEGTFRAASRAVEFVPVEPLSLKGKPEPVAAWRAERVLSERGGANRGDAPEPPFVGRDEDLRLVKEMLHATGREQRARLVLVTGVAGVGKSRLVWELQKYIDGLTEDIYWHQGRCPAYGEGVTFAALGEMVRRRAGILDGEDVDAARSRLGASLETLVTDDQERAWIEPRLAHLLGLGAAPAGDREENFAAWRRYFERVAALGTTVLVFEDLHWADPGLLSFVESLLDLSRAVPMLVIGLARPEAADRLGGWGAGHRSMAMLHLDRLPDEAVIELVEGYVTGLPADSLNRVVARAEGIPLYAVETVRMLADRGALDVEGCSYAVVPGAQVLAERLDVPETLHALAAARLDGLPDADRLLLQDAAVLGRSFAVPALAAVGELAEDVVDARLRELARRELVTRDADPRSPERGRWGFVQAVVREVAYSTLSKPLRRARHLAAARYLESQVDLDLGAVAGHYLAAYRAEPSADDGEGVAALARTWLVRAAERAQSLGSPEEALTYLDQALPLADEVAQRAPILCLGAEAATFTGETDRALAFALDAVAALRATDDDEGMGRFVSRVGRRGVFTRYPAESERMLATAREAVAGRRGVGAALVAALMAERAATTGHNEDAMEWSERAMELSAETADAEALRSAAASRAFALGNAGRTWEATLLARGVVELAERSGSAIGLARAQTILGIQLGESDARAQLETFAAAARAAGQAGDRPLQVTNLANLAESAADLGDWDRADAALVEARSVGWELDPEGLLFTEAMLAAMRGDQERARVALPTPEQVEADGAVQLATWYDRVRGVIALVAGDPAAAVELGLRGLRREPSGANAVSSAWLVVQACCAGSASDAAAATRGIEEMLALTLSLRGSYFGLVRATARAALDALSGGADPEAAARCLDEWHRLDAPLEHARATTALLWVLTVDGVPPEHVTRASATLDRLGAAALVARMHAAMGTRSRQGAPP